MLSLAFSNVGGFGPPVPSNTAPAQKAASIESKSAAAADVTTQVPVMSKLSAAALAVAATFGAKSLRRRGRGQTSQVVCQSVKAPVKIDGAPQNMRAEDELNRYRIAYAAEDAEPWRSGRVVNLEKGEAGVMLALEVDASREHVPLRDAYHTPGQRAQVCFDKTEESKSNPEVVAVATPPLSLASSAPHLWRLKGDIFAGSTKQEVKTDTLNQILEVYLPSSAVAKNIAEGDEVLVGPFTDEGMDLRPVLGRFQAPSVAIFCDGTPEAVCMLRAVLEAENCACELQIQERTCAMLFCSNSSTKLPRELEAWLQGSQERFGLAIADLGGEASSTWENSAKPAIQRLNQLGERLGALILGSPDFVKVMSSNLSAEGVDLVATSMDKMPLARCVDSEQI
eukprot:TRINITY_DN98581_c0_g1_i1.p1 TRINITY_DN98581_c0_g1~~TRINITY_DN98581_c0_g1_i1.p1  ORF type:complete len:396 (+),score=103.05 TRINITY_DN98581_c0_g1_i1:73-1260(+)